MMKRLSEMNDEIISQIYIIRGRKVMLDSDLARIYGVTTARLNQQVRRNKDRFPVDFMFELSVGEYHNLMLQFATSSLQITENVKDSNLMSQSVISSSGTARWGGRRKLPSVRSEPGPHPQQPESDLPT